MVKILEPKTFVSFRLHSVFQLMRWTFFSSNATADKASTNLVNFLMYADRDFSNLHKKDGKNMYYRFRNSHLTRKRETFCTLA